MDEFLKGITILDLTRYFPGPFATLRLLDRGAEVIKIEDLQGDPARVMDSINGAEGAVFRSMSRGKKCVALNLKSEADREKFYSLSDKADVVIESFRPGVAKRLGVDYDTLSARNQRLVYVSISGYGQQGSMAGKAGHDLNYMATAGVLDQLLDLSGNPITPKIALADLITGLAASEAVLAGLAGRTQSGRGSYQDLSMTDAVLSIMGLHVMTCSANGAEHGMNDNGIGYGVFRTKDGRYMTLCALEEKFFYNFCKAVGHEELLPYQHTEPSDSNEHFRAVADIIAERSFAEWCAFADEVDCCMAPVLHARELKDSVYVRERGMIETRWGLDYVATAYPKQKSFLPTDRPYAKVGEDNELYQ